MINHIEVDENLAPDFFSLTSVLDGGIGFFVSEKLKFEIEAAGCTGILFKALNESLF